LSGVQFGITRGKYLLPLCGFPNRFCRKASLRQDPIDNVAELNCKINELKFAAPNRLLVSS
jgi:hypothetical protein